MRHEWQKCFELQDGRPTGRWQWVIDGAECAYYFPGRWLNPESFAPTPPQLSPSEARHITRYVTPRGQVA